MKRIHKAIFLTIMCVICIAAVFIIKCPLYYVIGIPCPSCGMTRAYLSLLRGNILQAFSMHPLWWCLPFAVLIPIVWKIKTGNVHILKIEIPVLFILFIGVYAIRMLTLFPNTPPMDFNTDCLIFSILGG